MLKGRFKYLVLFIFLSSILLIVFLQYNSGKSIKNLITDNESLLDELRVKTKLQKLQTDIIFSESALRDLMITDGPEHILEIDRFLRDIHSELKEIDSVIRPTSQPELLDRLNFLTNEKIEKSNQIISTIYKGGRDSALALVRTSRGRIIIDSIILTVNLINQNRQTALSKISSSVSINGVKAKSWGIVLALIACLASIFAFWYLINQSQRQQRLIQTLDQSEKRLKQASKIQEQFVANISHEIRTPMNAVLGFAGLLQKTTLDQNQHEFVKSIRSSAENLLTIINDILDLSRIESGMMQIEKRPFNLKELLDSLLTMLKVKAKNRNLYLRAEIDKAIPFMIKGDAVRLTQILLNLISNALKFTHKGGVSVKLELAEIKEDTYWIRFIISDTGIGIDPEMQKAIFERFQQAQPETTRRYGGTGLGLSIVKQLVEIQNGKISVSSVPGKGSVFVVDLPYEISADMEKAVLSSPVVSNPAPFPKKVKLLVAEDNIMNRKLISHLLGHWKIEFDMVTDGRQAVDTLKQNGARYDMVLMDIQMPDMDGYTATEKIRYELRLSLPIIAMTAHALAGEKEKCLGAGMDDYISKPLDEELLYNLISKYAVAKKDTVSRIINMEYLRSLSGGDEEFEKKMIRSFSEQMPMELKELKMAISQKNYKKIGSIAHSMKSTVSYMGLHQLTPLLEQIENDSQMENGMVSIRKNFRSVETTCKLAINEAKLIS